MRQKTCASSKKINATTLVTKILLCVAVATGVLGITAHILASGTSRFTQTINPGTLNIDIVDGSYVSVTNPSFAMNTTSFSFAAQTVTGTFSAATQQIYVSNPSAANNGWTAALAGISNTTTWASSSTPAYNFKFNDAAGSGFTYGQMTVSTDNAIVAVGTYATSTTGVTAGVGGTFVGGSVDSVTIFQSNGTVDIGDWTLRNVLITQKIPASQPAANDYSIQMVLSITAT